MTTLIPALSKEGQEKFDDFHHQAVRQPRKRTSDGGIDVNAACHAPIAHWLGYPCIYFAPKPKWWRYPLVHERNVVAILVHESIHCALMNITLDGDLRAVQEGFDRLFPDQTDVRARGLMR